VISASEATRGAVPEGNPWLLGAGTKLYVQFAGVPP